MAERMYPSWRETSSRMQRSELTIDLGAIRRNVRRLLDVLHGAELWAVVKANGYGHGAVDVAGAALAAGASVLGVATVAEGLELREEFPTARILVMGPTATSREVASAREAALELVIPDGEIPEGVRVLGHEVRETPPAGWRVRRHEQAQLEHAHLVARERHVAEQQPGHP